MRGEIWTLRDEYYASKVRPVVIVQNDKVAVLRLVFLARNKRIMLSLRGEEFFG